MNTAIQALMSISIVRKTLWEMDVPLSNSPHHSTTPQHSLARLFKRLLQGVRYEAEWINLRYSLCPKFHLESQHDSPESLSFFLSMLHTQFEDVIPQAKKKYSYDCKVCGSSGNSEILFGDEPFVFNLTIQEMEQDSIANVSEAILNRSKEMDFEFSNEHCCGTCNASLKDTVTISFIVNYVSELRYRKSSFSICGCPSACIDGRNLSNEDGQKWCHLYFDGYRHVWKRPLVLVPYPVEWPNL
jgi:hypothetical protein